MGTNEQRLREAEVRLWQSVEMDPPAERMIRLEPYGIEARVQEVGNGPPVLFIHGANVGGASWAHLICRLQGFRCIALDRPGCSLSEPAPIDGRDIAAVKAYGDDLIASVLDALEIERAHIAATSYGGLFALRGAAAHPGRVDRMVLFSWCAGAPMAKISLLFRIAAFRPLGLLMARMPVSRTTVKMTLRQVGLRGAIASGKFHDEAIDWAVAMLRHTDTFLNEMRAAAPLFTPFRGINEAMLHSAELLGRIEAPTYFFWGEDDPQGGAEQARAFSAMLPDAELELVPNAGHAPWIDEPERAAAAVHAFLKT